MNEAMILEVVKDVTITVCGGFVGAKINDRLIKGRERESRRRKFLGFLEGWRAEISHADASTNPMAVKDAFERKRPALAEIAATVRDCFDNPVELEKLVKGIRDMDSSCLCGFPDGGRESLLKNTEPLLNFIRKRCMANAHRAIDSQPTANELLDLSLNEISAFTDFGT